jgi:hypothetical protein
MADFTIASLRGGLNNSDPSNAIPDDQVTVAQNVEFITSMLGERRRGATAIDISGSDLVGHDRVPFLHRHLPTTDETEAQLWALGVTGTASSSLVYKDTAWQTVSPTDAITISGTYQYQLQAQSLHGKLFIAYKSDQDRLHVWDGTTLRRCGLAEPSAAPTAADSGSGSFDGDRYYRVRWALQSSGTTILRSEPSDTLTFSPSGSGSGATVTRPTITGADTGITHWELEASVDSDNFYVIATTAIATTTATDTAAYTPGYAQAFTLSEDVGDYTLIPSGRFLLVDRDRLVILGSFEDNNLSSRVAWTPVLKDSGVGNDERLELDSDPFLDLDPLDGGPITGGIAANGSIWVFKRNHIYLLTASGITTRAYDVTPISKVRGAIQGSIVEGVDQAGNPVIYFLDPAVGACYISIGGGVRQCGADIRATWATVNPDAANVIARSVFYPEARQIHWWVASDDADTPDLRLVLQTNEMEVTKDGARRGWTLWDGPSAQALAVCMFAENIDDDTARSHTLRPFIGIEGSGLVWRTDTGDDDNGTDYTAWIATKPYTPIGVLHQFEVKSGTLLAHATADALIDVKVTRDFGLETVTVEGVTLDPEASETQVIKPLADLAFAELRVAQAEFKDPAIPGTRWAINGFSMREERGMRA